jgi:hypothetical protein
MFEHRVNGRESSPSFTGQYGAKWRHTQHAKVDARKRPVGSETHNDTAVTEYRARARALTQFLMLPSQKDTEPNRASIQ